MKLFDFFRRKKSADLENYSDKFIILNEEGDVKFLYSEDRETSFLDILKDERSITKEDLVKLYEKLGWVYAGIRTIANAFSILDFKIVKKDKVEGELREVEVDHPIVDLLENPNPEMSFSDLMEAIAIFLESLGECFIEIVYDSNGKPVELYPLISYRVQVVLTPDKKSIKGYLYRLPDGTEVKFLKDEVLHIKYYNPFTDLYGMPALLPVKQQVAIERYADKHLKNFFENGAIPGGVLKVERVLTDEQYKRILKRWEQAHRGADKHYRIAILEAGMDYKDVALSFRDAEVINLKKLDREQILGALGVPLGMVGIRDRANYATLDFERKVFWEDTIIPKTRKIESAINKKLVHKFRVKNVKFRFDFDKVGALKESLETRARVSRMLSDGGILKINEIRREFFNKPPVDWGETWYQPLNLIPVDSGRKPENTGGRKPGLDNTKPKPKAVLSAELTSYKTLFDAADYFMFRESWSMAFVQSMKPHFEDQRIAVKEVISAYVPLGIASKADYLELLPILLREIDNALYRNQNTMVDSYFTYFVRCLNRAGSEVLAKLYEMGKVNDLIFTPDIDIVKDLGEEWAETFTVEVNATTFNLLKKALESDEILSNISYTTISNTVHNVFEGIIEKLSEKKNRIEKMAYTEFNGIWNCGIWLAGKQAGMKYKIWKTFGDNPRESHKVLDNVKIEIDERFIVGKSKARFPSDWLLAPSERINCYCAIDLE